MVGTRDFSVPPKHLERLWGPSSPKFNVYQILSSKKKRPVREVDYSHPSIAMVDMSGTIHLLPLYAFVT
jgi:hypothetical protein